MRWATKGSAFENRKPFENELTENFYGYGAGFSKRERPPARKARRGFRGRIMKKKEDVKKEEYGHWRILRQWRG